VLTVSSITALGGNTFDTENVPPTAAASRLLRDLCSADFTSLQQTGWNHFDKSERLMPAPT
jgi:hypothetical protein